jgi:hypothetical protein
MRWFYFMFGWEGTRSIHFLFGWTTLKVRSVLTNRTRASPFLSSSFLTDNIPSHGRIQKPAPLQTLWTHLVSQQGRVRPWDDGAELAHETTERGSAMRSPTWQQYRARRRSKLAREAAERGSTAWWRTGGRLWGSREGLGYTLASSSSSVAPLVSLLGAASPTPLLSCSSHARASLIPPGMIPSPRF